MAFQSTYAFLHEAKWEIVKFNVLGDYSITTHDSGESQVV